MGSSFKIRTKYLLNPEYQLSFVGYMMFFSFALTGIYYFALTLFFSDFKNQGRAIGLDVDHVFFLFMEEQKKSFDHLFILISFGIFLMILGFGLFLSHRVAGPLYEFSRYLRASTKGDEPYRELRFRKGDYFQELKDDFNLFQNKLVTNLPKADPNSEAKSS